MSFCYKKASLKTGPFYNSSCSLYFTESQLNYKWGENSRREIEYYERIAKKILAADCGKISKSSTLKKHLAVDEYLDSLFRFMVFHGSKP